MKPLLAKVPLPVAIALVGASGFAGGIVFFPGVLESSRVSSPGTFGPAGLAGVILFLALWLTVSAALRRRFGKNTMETARSLGPWFAVSLAPLISYLPYLLYRSGLAGDTVTQPPLGSRPSAIILLIWSLALLALLLRITVGGQSSRLLNRLTVRPHVTLGMLMAAWVAAFFILDVLKLHYMQVNQVNSVLFIESMTHVFDPRGFMYSNLLHAEGASLFGVHINAIFIFLVPVIRLWPDYRLLLLISDIALALTAVPAYLIARRHFSAAVSLLLSAMVILHPIIAAQPGRSDVSELRFMPVLFLTAFYLFEKKKFWSFAGVTLIMMTIREDMGLFVAFFGLYALIRRRSWKWILGPAAWGAAWFLVMGTWLLPHMNPSGQAVRAGVRYSSLGSNGREIVKTLIFRPWKVLQAALATPSHIGAAYGLIISFGVGIGVLSAAIFMAVPAIAELLLQESTTFTNFTAIPVVPTMMIAVIYGLARLGQLCQRFWSASASQVSAVAAVIIFFLALAPFHTWFQPKLYEPRYNFEAAQHAAAMVPKDARVIVPEFLYLETSPDQLVTGYHQITYQKEFEGGFVIDEDYVIVDDHVPARGAKGSGQGDDHVTRYYTSMRDVADFVSSSPDFRRVFSDNDIELYVRRGFEPAQEKFS